MLAMKVETITLLLVSQWVQWDELWY